MDWNDPTLREVLVKIDDQVIGHITPTGRWLERVAFRALRPSARIRAYLGLVAPAARRARTIARVCGIPATNVHNFTKADCQHGRIVHNTLGYAIMPPAVVYTHVARTTE